MITKKKILKNLNKIILSREMRGPKKIDEKEIYLSLKTRQRFVDSKKRKTNLYADEHPHFTKRFEKTIKEMC